MINRIIEFSMKNRWLILGVYAVLAVWGYWALLHTPIDAIPDLSENQVIVFTEWQGRSPQEVEDQITYPLTVNLQGLPHVRSVRSSSAFGFSMVNVIFEDSVDIYFARTRVLERLSLAGSFLPAGVTPMMGPDATGVGQVFWYTVEGPYDSGTLHSIQDWFIKYQLNSVPGVAEVASVGGFVKQYQIDLGPIKLRAYNVALKDVIAAVERSNNNVGAKVIETGDTESMVRGIGLIGGLKDIENISLGAYNGTPVTIGNVGSVQLGPEFRRGVLGQADRLHGPTHRGGGDGVEQRRPQVRGGVGGHGLAGGGGQPGAELGVELGRRLRGAGTEPQRPDDLLFVEMPDDLGRPVGVQFGDTGLERVAQRRPEGPGLVVTGGVGAHDHRTQVPQ